MFKQIKHDEKKSTITVITVVTVVKYDSQPWLL